MRRILITGGAGFVGRHFTQYYLAKKDSVTVVDNLLEGGGGSLPPAEWLTNPDFRFHQVDCVQFLNQNSEKFDLVIHLAARIGGRIAIETKQFEIMRNSLVDLALIEWCVRTGPEHLIAFSSSAVYPVRLQALADRHILEEKDFAIDNLQGIPDQSYGWTKQNLEYLVNLYHKTTQRKCTIYRPFSGYGEGQSDRYPIPNLCRIALALKENEQMAVWGSGRQVRDFIHIEDIVRLVDLSYQRLPNADVLNLSSAQPISFIEVAELLLRILGKKNKIHCRNDLPSGVEFRCGSNLKLKQLGLDREVELEVGLQRVIKSLA